MRSLFILHHGTTALVVWLVTVLSIAGLFTLKEIILVCLCTVLLICFVQKFVYIMLPKIANLNDPDRLAIQSLNPNKQPVSLVTLSLVVEVGCKLQYHAPSM